MGKVYDNGIKVITGFKPSGKNPIVDNQDVDTFNDLLTLAPVFNYMRVTVHDEDGAQYMWNGLDQSDSDNWIKQGSFDGSIYELLLPATPDSPDNKFLNGNKLWTEIALGSGGYASNLYLSAINSDVSGYKTLSYSNDLTETECSSSVSNSTGEVLCDTFLFSDEIGIEVIPAGKWGASFYSKVSSSVGTTTLRAEIFLRHIDNSETVLDTTVSDEINNTDYETLPHEIEKSLPQFNVVTTDRLGIKFYASTTSNVARTLTVIVGDGRGAYMTTPLELRHNQLRDLNGDAEYQHITSADRTLLDGIPDLTNVAYKNVDNKFSKFQTFSSGATSGTGSNVRYGTSALISTTTGSGNTAIGQLSLTKMTTGATNVAIGTSAMNRNITGFRNVAIGYGSMELGSGGNQNVAVGYKSLRAAISTQSNVAIGQRAIENMTIGSGNTAIGEQSQGELITGSGNVSVGAYSSLQLIDETDATAFINSTYVGTQTVVSANDVTNENVFGYNATGKGSNTVTLGNSDITDVYTFGTYNTPAISPLSSAPADINAPAGTVLTADGSGGSAWLEGDQDLSPYVTLDTIQTVTGKKIFTGYCEASSDESTYSSFNFVNTNAGGAAITGASYYGNVENIDSRYLLGRIGFEKLYNSKYTKAIINTRDYNGDINRLQYDGTGTLKTNGKAFALETIDWYGVEWNSESGSTECTRIGNLDMHVSLPIHNERKRCLVWDNGTVHYYLDPDDSTKKEDGTAAILDGTDGQLMVENPKDVYISHTVSGTVHRFKISKEPLDGFTKMPNYFIGACEATLERSTGKLCSIYNTGVDYRGGNNTSTWDGQSNSLLGMPVTNLTRAEFRTAAALRGSKWHINLKSAHSLTAFLYIIEYANLNSQLAFNSSLTTEGYRQGGLGEDNTNANSTEWNNFNSNNPVLNNSLTFSLGNNTGVVSDTITDFGGTGIDRTFSAHSYRGEANIFGHIWKLVDGFNINEHIAYITDDLDSLADNTSNGYSLKGTMPSSNGYQYDFLQNNLLIPSKVTGTTSISDYYYQSTGWRVSRVGGLLYTGSSAGLFSLIVFDSSSDRNSDRGARLCLLDE